MSDKSEMTTLTCISPDPHENNIRDHILHFLGCVEISTRNEFLKIPSDVQSDEEVATAATAVQLEQNQQDRGIDKQKEAAWREDCLSELRHIAFLRSKLEKDDEEKHLVEKIEESREAWRGNRSSTSTGLRRSRNGERKNPKARLKRQASQRLVYQRGTTNQAGMSIPLSWYSRRRTLPAQYMSPITRKRTRKVRFGASFRAKKRTFSDSCSIRRKITLWTVVRTRRG